MVAGCDEGGKAGRAPVARAVVLGASNVSRGLGALVPRARGAFDGAVDLLIADGRGRSFGLATSFLAHSRFSLADCGLWSELAERQERAPLPLSALVTDVGNDVLYGASAARIADWVETCAERLAEHGARLVMTPLARARLDRLGPREYAFWRRLFFPSHAPVAWDDVLRILPDLDERVRRIADELGAALVEPRADWYGLDPVHVRLARRRAAWDAILEPWGRARPPVGAWPGQGLWLDAQAPAERQVLGRRRRRAQPAVRFADGSRVSFF